jgi:hypothetical protein
MMTVREAMQRCELNRVRIKRTGYGTEWLVTLVEWTRKQIDEAGYYTDDLEDAVLTGAAMRRSVM